MSRERGVSEHAAWSEIIESATEVQRLIRSKGTRQAVIDSYLNKILAVADGMRRQVDRGIHENPALVMYGNPAKVGPGDTIGIELGVLLGFVERLDYERVAKPQGFYFHDFGSSDALWTATMRDGQRVVLLANVNARPLWDHR